MKDRVIFDVDPARLVSVMTLHALIFSSAPQGLTVDATEPAEPAHQMGGGRGAVCSDSQGNLRTHGSARWR